MTANIKKVLIYPYNRKVLPLVKYLSYFNNEYQIMGLVSPSGWGMTGKDASYANNSQEAGIIIQADYHELLSDCDLVYIPQTESESLLYWDMMKLMREAIKEKKDIICAAHICEEGEQELLNLSLEKNVSVTFLARNREMDNKSVPLQLEDINVPVIFVGEIIKDLQGTETFLSVIKFFREKGYQVSGIGEEEYCHLLKLNRIPCFMNDNIDNNYKIEAFNNFVKDIERNEEPDIIFIQLPGGMMQYNKVIKNDYGILPYLISVSVPSDGMILLVNYGDYNKEFYESINSLFEKRFYTEVYGLIMTNDLIDMSETLNSKKINKIYIDPNKMIDKAYSTRIQNKIPIFSNNSDQFILFENIIQNLYN